MATYLLTYWFRKNIWNSKLIQKITMIFIVFALFYVYDDHFPEA